jgi:glycosyltransferase involved in cell wall biosynthesis
MGKTIAHLLNRINDEIDLVAIKNMNDELVYEIDFENEISLPSRKQSNRVKNLYYHTRYIPQLIKQHSLDLVHAPSQGVPLYFWFLSVPTVVTIHGAAAHVLDKDIHRQPTRAHTVPYRLFKHRLRKVITVSESSKLNIMKYYDIPGEHIEVIYHGVDDSYYERENSEEIRRDLREKYDIPFPFILDVSRTQPKKNVSTLIEAFAPIVSEGFDHSLVLVGGESWGHNTVIETIKREGIEDRVYFAPYIDEEDMPKLYSLADLLCFPTLHEGFGLPIVEAMACGTPVITSNVYSCPEVAGEAAILIDPLDTTSITNAIRQTLTTDDLRMDLRQKGLNQADKFDWGENARKHIAVYREIVNSSK